MAQHVGRFRFEVITQPGGVIEMEWDGHMDVASARAVCAELEQRASSLDRYFLLIESRGLTGYDPEARDHARRWSRSEAAMRGVVVALVTESELTAAESPAVALAPPRRVRLFGSRGAARRYLDQRAQVGSGEYPVDALRVTEQQRRKIG